MPWVPKYIFEISMEGQAYDLNLLQGRCIFLRVTWTRSLFQVTSWKNESKEAIDLRPESYDNLAAGGKQKPRYITVQRPSKQCQIRWDVNPMQDTPNNQARQFHAVPQIVVEFAA